MTGMLKASALAAEAGGHVLPGAGRDWVTV